MLRASDRALMPTQLGAQRPVTETTNAAPQSHGLCDTERQALAGAEPMYTAARRNRVRGSLIRANAAALRDTLAAATVELDDLIRPS